MVIITYLVLFLLLVLFVFISLLHFEFIPLVVSHSPRSSDSRAISATCTKKKENTRQKNTTCPRSMVNVVKLPSQQFPLKPIFHYNRVPYVIKKKVASKCKPCKKKSNRGREETPSVERDDESGDSVGNWLPVPKSECLL